nr:PIN domain-containing protein [Rhizobium laguerreae]
MQSEALSERIKHFLHRVDVVPWDHDITRAYGDLRTACEAKSMTLSPLDMMIAAHAVATAATLVTRDKAFPCVSERLKVNDWANEES